MHPGAASRLTFEEIAFLAIHQLLLSILHLSMNDRQLIEGLEGSHMDYYNYQDAS